jgi:polar amino acid transport system substrate-binding protein
MLHRLCSSPPLKPLLTVLRILLLTLLTLLTSLNAIASTNEAPTIIYAPELPPYIVSSKDGKPQGLMVDIVLEAFHRAKLPVSIKIVPWARGYKMVAAKPGLGLIPTLRTTEREQLFQFSEQALFRYKEVWFKQRGAAIPWDGSMASIAKLRLIKMRDGLTAPPIDEALKSGLLKAYQIDSFQNALKMLSVNHADLLPMPQITGLSLIKQLGLEAKIEAIEPPIFEQAVYLAFSRDAANTALIAQLDKALKTMWSDGSIKAFSAKY